MNLTFGINLGGWMSQTRRYRPEFITEADFAAIRDMGFDHVRLPVDFDILADCGTTPLSRAVDWAEACGLSIIVDLHKAPGYDFNAAENNGNTLFSSPELQERFLKIWDRLSRDYGARPHVAFELLNEVVEREAAQPWNDLIRRAVRVIRGNTGNTIIYGGIQWNQAEKLALLDQPETENVVFTFHFYEPLVFTHQKAPWLKHRIDQEQTVQYPDTMARYRELCAGMDFADNVTSSRAGEIGRTFMEEQILKGVRAAEKAGVPIYCGEYGVIDRAPAEDSLRWLQTANAVFDQYGIGRALWTYRQMDFGLMDPHYDSIREGFLALNPLK